MGQPLSYSKPGKISMKTVYCRRRACGHSKKKEQFGPKRHPFPNTEGGALNYRRLCARHFLPGIRPFQRQQYRGKGWRRNFLYGEPVPAAQMPQQSPLYQCPDLRSHVRQQNNGLLAFFQDLSIVPFRIIKDPSPFQPGPSFSFLLRRDTQRL